MEKPWLDAIRDVLHSSDGALHYTEIAERIVGQGLRDSVGATPHRTVATYLSNSLRRSDDSPFVRVGKGEYALKEVLADKQSPPFSEEFELSEETEAGALRAFGMFWNRGSVNWNKTRPSLLGRQGLGALAVDFSDQIGIYLLHDRDRVIYVGRATDGLCVRLRAHISDRLAGRWDRFSWFGLMGVGEDGKLRAGGTPWTQSSVIDTMEALLIESLEPPLNRKRGDNLSAVEYLQVQDPEIDKSERRAFFEEIRERILGDTSSR